MFGLLYIVRKYAVLDADMVTGVLLLRLLLHGAPMESSQLTTCQAAHQYRIDLVLMKICYRSMFFFIVPTWYCSTGTFDNPSL